MKRTSNTVHVKLHILTSAGANGTMTAVEFFFQAPKLLTFLKTLTFPYCNCKITPFPIQVQDH